jgi:hypothetical protein
MSRERSRKAALLSPLLVRLIEAAERSGEDAEGREIRGAAKALREFGDLAVWVLPVHGLFVPNNQEVCTIVDRVAHQHLDLEEARREFKGALSVVGEFAQRDPIETAHNRVRAASEEAYFYAGLAFGLTFAEYRSLSAALNDTATRGPRRGKRHESSN